MSNLNLENIIVFINPKSGGQKAYLVFEHFKKYLSNENVFDLSIAGPKPGLVYFKLILFKLSIFFFLIEKVS